MAGLKMTGAEYKAFTATEWGPDWYWDETSFLHNDVEVDDIGEVADTDTIVILCGTVFKGQDVGAQAIAAVPFARKWLKARSVTSVLIEVANERLDAVRALLKTMEGVRIV